MGRKKRPKLEPNLTTEQQSLSQQASQSEQQQPPPKVDTRIFIQETCVPIGQGNLMIPPPLPTAVASNDPRLKNQKISFDPKLPNDKPTTLEKSNANAANTTNNPSPAPASSSYGMHSHAGDLIEEDIYISDGSDDEDGGIILNTSTTKNTTTGDATSTSSANEPIDNSLELMLTGSKMGLMRRGLTSQLFQPKTWVRSDTTNNNTTTDEKDGQIVSEEEGQSDKSGDGTLKDEQDETKQQQSEHEAILQNPNLTPAQKAAQLITAKKQKEEELKILKRRNESSENAGRDPCLFSKRTAFDIRMDQIEDKPWDRATGGTADATDYFNYGLSEEDWLEYSERQLTVRQELTDASRQRRSADPTIVPVVPKTPSKQAPKVAVAVKKEKKKEVNESETNVLLGPTVPADLNSKVKTEDDATKNTADGTAEKEDADTVSTKQSNKAVDGGVWGVDITPGSTLAKLIEEQERNAAMKDSASMSSNNMDMMGNNDNSNFPPPPPPPPSMQQHNMPFQNQHDFQQQQYHHQGGPPPPPPPSFQNQRFPPPPPGGGNFGGRGGRGGGQFYQNDHGFHGGRGRGGGRFQGRGDGPPPPHHAGGRGGFHPNQQFGYGGGRGGRGGNFHGGGRGRGGFHGGPPPFNGGGRGRGGRGYMRDNWHGR